MFQLLNGFKTVQKDAFKSSHHVQTHALRLNANPVKRIKTKSDEPKMDGVVAGACMEPCASEVEGPSSLDWRPAVDIPAGPHMAYPVIISFYFAVRNKALILLRKMRSRL